MLFGSLDWGLQERAHIGFRALGRTVPPGATRGRLVLAVQVWWYRTRQDPELGCPLGSRYPGGHPASLSPCANTHSRALGLVGTPSPILWVVRYGPWGSREVWHQFEGAPLGIMEEHSPQPCMSISGVTLNKHWAPTGTTAVILQGNRTC